MQEKLIKILKKYSLEDIIEIEENDRQFIALKNLFEKIENTEFFLPLIITNSLLSYQLSSKWEDYWEEFSDFALKYKFSKEFNKKEIFDFFKEFLPESRWNKRLLNMKMPRLEKIIGFLDEFSKKEDFFYKNQIHLRDLLVAKMKQKKDDKTIVFSIKMFNYWARICFKKFIPTPFDISMPIDSRILKITKAYNDKWKDIIQFWNDVSKEIWIPSIHLDALLWIKCNDFICL